MNALDKLKERAPDLEFELPDGTPVVKLGLIVTLYFKEGYTTESKQKVVECFERFYEEFKSHLKWQVYRRDKKLTAASFKKTMEQILATEPNEQYHWHLSSATTDKEAEDYSLSTMNSFEVHRDKKRSYIKLTLPWSFLTVANGLSRFHMWIEFLCNQVKAEHGYAGPSIILPYDDLNYRRIETELAQQFLGVEVDSSAFSMGRHLLEHIKGINWYTILGSTFVERLGGVESISRHLSQEAGVHMQSIDNGLIIRAGKYPELGAKDDALPTAYVLLNELVKPIRSPDIGALLCSPGSHFFDEDVTARWVARFDLDKPDAAPLKRVGADQPCPRTGYWKAWEQTEDFHHFTQGETMPWTPGAKSGETLWYWSHEGNE